jgi:cell division protein FtsZ
MVRPGIINLDFADVRSVMDEMGKAMMGTGEATGEERAKKAAESAIANPLLDEISLKSAKGVLINITGSQDMTLFELDEAANRIREEVDPDAHIIVGSTLDPELDGIRVSVVATGIDVEEGEVSAPVARRPMSEPLKPQPIPAVEEAVVMEADEAPVAASFIDQQVAMEADVEDAPVAESVAEAPVAAPIAPTEATLRLKAAVSNVPAPAEVPAPTPEVEKPTRFAINNLINRMTGHAKDEKPTPRVQPSMHTGSLSAPAHDIDREEQERVDIPAFLRRQAN